MSELDAEGPSTSQAAASSASAQGPAPARRLPPPGPVSSQRIRGRPVLGAIFGLLFGVFVAVDLVMFGVIAFESAMSLVLAVVGLAGGIALGLWGPLGRASGAPGGPTS